MADLGDELVAVLGDPGATPTRGPDLARYVGGADELVRALTGLARRPGDVAGQRLWDSARRRVQRQTTTTGGQRRGGKRGFELTADQRRRVRRAAAAHRSADMRRRGARMRLTALVRKSSPGGRDDIRQREMPAGGPGELIDADTMATVLDLLAEEDPGGAGEELAAAFFEAYEVPEMEIVDVITLHLWPEGGREPA